MGLKITGTSPVRLNQAQVCVLYDESGKIFHIHHHLSLGERASEREIEIEAREAAQEAPYRHRRNLPSELRALQVPADEFDTSKAFRVDPRRKVLVEDPELRVSDRA